MRILWVNNGMGIIALAAVLSVSSACAPAKRQVIQQPEEVDALEEWKGKKPQNMPERLELKLNEGLEADAFLEVSAELSDWKTEELELTRHLLDERECLDDLLELAGAPKVVKRKHSLKEDTLEDGTPIKVDHAELENGDWVQARNLYFLGRLSSIYGMPKPSDTFIAEHGGYYDNVEMNRKLSFGGCEEVCEKIENFLKKQKIENVLKPIIYSFTPELLQQAADRHYQEIVAAGFGEKDEEVQAFHVTYEKEDGVYLIRYMQGYNGIPLDYLGVAESDITGINDETDTSVFYVKQGITEISGGYYFDIEKVGEEKQILSLYDILKKFQDSHRRKAGDKITIKQIGLSYLPVLADEGKLKYDGTPVWYLVYDDGTSTIGVPRNVATYNAVTGEIYK